MDPNPNNFPILSYVMAKVPSFRQGSFRRPAGLVNDEHDIEQPSSSTAEVSTLKEPHFELTEQMPHLKNPEIFAAMRLAVADVAQSRSVLKTLGERPDHESVDRAKAKLAEVEANISGQMDEIVLSPKKGGKGEEEGGGWKALEREKELCKSVISLDEMHETYEYMLRGAEERLQKIYDAAVAGSPGEEMEEEKKEVVVEEVDEEVVALLKDFEANKIIEKVNLSARKLRLMPEAFGKIKSMVVLDLSSNQIEAVPDSIAGLENLEELNLSSNLLETLPDSIGLLFKLKVLDVSGNKLTSLPDSICHCRSLVELNAGFNKLTYLPTNIGHELENLMKLWVPLNKIRYLPTSIGEMKSLRLLDVHFNELHGIPSSIGKLTNLEILNLSGNFSDLSELPSTIGDLANLRELELSNNQIHELPDTFGMLQNLSKFNIDQNPLVMPPKEIVAEGIEAIKAYMVRRRLDILLAEEHMSTDEGNDQANASLLARSTSWFSNVVANVTETVSSYIGAPEKSKDPCLNEQR